jgi:hypothetical protein
MSRFLVPLRPTLAVAGVLLTLSDLLEELNSGATFSAGARSLPWQTGAALGLVGMFVLAVALVAVHARQAERSGRLGLIAALVAGAGAVLMSGVSWSTAFLDPAAARVVPAFLDNTPPAILVIGYFGSLALFATGWVFYAIVTLRAGVFPRIPVVLMLLGALLVALPFAPYAMTVFGIGLLWLGLAPERQGATSLAPAT